MNAQDQNFETMEENRNNIRENDELVYGAINGPLTWHRVSFKPYPRPLDSDLRIMIVLTKARGLSFVCYHARTDCWYYMREVPSIDIEFLNPVNILSVDIPEVKARYENLVKTYTKSLTLSHEAALEAVLWFWGSLSVEEVCDDDEGAQMAVFDADF